MCIEPSLLNAAEEAWLRKMGRQTVEASKDHFPNLDDTCVSGTVNGKEVTSDGKADTGKVRMSLLYVQFGKCLYSMANVLTFGALKYPKPPLDDSWRDVPNGRQRYTDAAYRHLHAYFVLGEKIDPESGESHLAHAVINLLFVWRLDDGKE